MTPQVYRKQREESINRKSVSGPTFQHLIQPLGQLFGRAQFASPDRDDPPAQRCQIGLHLTVAGDIRFELLEPEIGAGLGGVGEPAALVAVPEAAVDKDRGLVPGKDDVGFAGEVSSVKAKPIAHTMQQRANSTFRFCVTRLDAGHNFRALVGGENIGHM